MPPKKQPGGISPFSCRCSGCPCVPVRTFIVCGQMWELGSCYSLETPFQRLFRPPPFACCLAFLKAIINGCIFMNSRNPSMNPRNRIYACSYQALEFWKNREPTSSLPPAQVIGLLMAALQKNDSPVENEGLRTVSEVIWLQTYGLCRGLVLPLDEDARQDMEDGLFLAIRRSYKRRRRQR